MLRSSNDDGPKLREEKQFEEFYTDLEKNTLLPIVAPQDNSITTSNKAESKEGDQDAECTYDHVPSIRTHMKEIIFNDTVTLEPIKLHHNKKSFKRCNISIAELDTVKVQSSSRTRKLKQYKKDNCYTFNEDQESYISKFSRIGNNIGNTVISKASLVNISKNLSSFQIEYDMDEQDELYLHYLNENFSDNRLTHEKFELLMSVLEVEWHHLEKKIPPRNISANACLSDHRSETGRLHYELYGSDDGTGTSTDQVCAVCGTGDSESSNAIVFCDGCDVAVHQECYGIVFIPEGQWLCRRCLVSKNRRVNCLFCPSHTGAFKQTDTGSWAHIVCGLWIPELYFANIHYMEPIEGVENISKSRWKLLCSICKQRMGACIQCVHKNCFTAYHVTCAKRAGLYMDYGGVTIGEIASNQVQPSHMLRSYCERHAPSHWPKNPEGILKTRRYFSEFNDSTTVTNLTEKMAGSQSNHQVNRWKTNRGTPIAPHLFANILQRILTNLDIPNAQQLSYSFCRYWSMKREMKRGASLVRKFNPSCYNILDENQLNERLEVTDILLEDLNKLNVLTNLVKKRTNTQEKLQETNRNIQSIKDYPREYLLRHVLLENFIPSETFKVLEKSLHDEKSQSFLLGLKSSSVGTILTAIDKIIQLFADLEISQTISRTTLGNVRRAKKLLDDLIKGVDCINPLKSIQRDFIFDGKSSDGIKPRRWKGPYLKEQEDLSDVDELSSLEIRKLNQVIGVKDNKK